MMPKKDVYLVCLTGYCCRLSLSTEMESLKTDYLQLCKRDLHRYIRRGARAHPAYVSHNMIATPSTSRRFPTLNTGPTLHVVQND